jgi:hypothetical protein
MLRGKGGVFMDLAWMFYVGGMIVVTLLMPTLLVAMMAVTWKASPAALRSGRRGFGRPGPMALAEK